MLASFYAAAVMIYGLIDRISLFGWMVCGKAIHAQFVLLICIGAISGNTKCAAG
jgi:hypothetical protein